MPRKKLEIQLHSNILKKEMKYLGINITKEVKTLKGKTFKITVKEVIENIRKSSVHGLAELIM